METFAVMRRAMDGHDRVCCLPIAEARLIHGDYNTWNVLLTDDLTRVTGVIDPFGCRWAGPKWDLYQLNLFGI